MLGTMWVNTGFGALASVITFFTALAGNVWLVSLERAGYAFILFFLQLSRYVGSLLKSWALSKPLRPWFRQKLPRGRPLGFRRAG